jgi:transposase InsO family protein
VYGKLKVSERRACRVIGQPRSTQRYLGQKAERDRPLMERIIVLSKENPRYGYRRVWALLRREGFEINKKRVHRLWREAGLKVPTKNSARGGVLAPVRTDVQEGGRSTGTTYGATTSSLTEQKTLVG